MTMFVLFICRTGHHETLSPWERACPHCGNTVEPDEVWANQCPPLPPKDGPASGLS